MLTQLLIAAVLAASPKPDSKLVGTWNAGGMPFMTLEGDGTGQMEEDPIRWSTQNGKLKVTDSEGEADVVTYQVEGDTLTISMGGIPMMLTRAGKGGKAAAKASAPVGEEAPPQKQKGAAASKPDAKDPLAKLLLSSAWCSFSYNKTTGTSRQSRVQFLSNGTWSSGRQAETYSSGYGGTVAGQYNSGAGGRWAVRGGTLYMSNPPDSPELAPVESFSVTRNSNGYPIVQAEGMEYSQCQ